MTRVHSPEAGLIPTEQSSGVSPMLERAARAILAKVPYGYGMTGPEAHDYARAALQAIREPDDTMQEAGYVYAPNQREQFTAMIDAILQGGE